MDAIAALLTRHSCAKLSAPAPSSSALAQAFSCALRAPDHRVLHPWRYLVIEGEGLQHLGDLLLAAGLSDQPELDNIEKERLQKMPLRAPMIVVAITSRKNDSKVPYEEQLLSTGAAVQNFMIALHAQGFGSMWRTGPLSLHPVVANGLGLAKDERIAGFVYIGTSANTAREYTPLSTQEFVKTWPH